MPTQRRADVAMILLIALQWFLLGGFPLIKPSRWWAEPGIIITAGTVLSGLLVLIPKNELASVPMLLAWFAWPWWFGLPVWKTVRAGWRLAARSAALTRGS
jgi:hypothetical protein